MKILNRSRKRSYGKKVAHRQLTRRKQKSLGVRREANPTLAPMPAGQFSVGLWAFFLPVAIIALSIDPVVGLYFLIFLIVFIIGAIQSLKNSRGGW